MFICLLMECIKLETKNVFFFLETALVFPQLLLELFKIPLVIKVRPWFNYELTQTLMSFRREVNLYDKAIGNQTLTYTMSLLIYY